MVDESGVQKLENVGSGGFGLLAVIVFFSELEVLERHLKRVGKWVVQTE
jgi:hypothetical protein